MIDRVFDLWGVYDNKEKVICLVRNTDAKDLCDLLNELHEENELLHLRNNRLEEKIQRERTSFIKTHEWWSKEAENKIKELSEENEQLIIELGALRKKYNDFSDAVDKRLQEVDKGLLK